MLQRQRTGLEVRLNLNQISSPNFAMDQTISQWPHLQDTKNKTYWLKIIGVAIKLLSLHLSFLQRLQSEGITPNNPANTSAIICC